MRHSFLWALLPVLFLGACTAANPDATGEAASSSARSRYSLEQITNHAENGDKDFQFELGVMYHDGDGVPKDDAKAVEWLTKSANAGNKFAAFNLGLMYRTGDGVSADLALAKRWFTRAEELNEPRGAFNMGLMYYQGDGVGKDFAKAYEHFRRAAMLGSAEGQLNVGLMLYKGEGVAQNAGESAAWFTIASENGNERAKELLTKIEPQLSAEQKSTVEARAKEIKAEIAAPKGISVK